MFSISEKEQQCLTALGSRLREYRRQYPDRRDSQLQFAARIGISVPTYRKMERGDPSVPIGYWIRALSLFDHLDDMEQVLVLSLFHRLES